MEMVLNCFKKIKEEIDLDRLFKQEVTIPINNEDLTLLSLFAQFVNQNK